MVKGMLEPNLVTSIYNAQRGIRSVLYNVVEQKMLDLLLKKVIREISDAHISKVL